MNYNSIDILCLSSVVQYNSWFTFSEYEEPVTVRSCRPIHAKELATVSFQPFIWDTLMFVGLHLP